MSREFILNQSTKAELVKIVLEVEEKNNELATELSKELAEHEEFVKKSEKEIKVLDKALDLACERIKNMYEQEQHYCTKEIDNFTQVEFNYFIQQAKKELQGEK